MTDKPTICVECANVFPVSQGIGGGEMVTDLLGHTEKLPIYYVAIPEQFRCRVEEWDLILGGKRQAFCMKKNDGHCLDFKPKEEAQK